MSSSSSSASSGAPGPGEWRSVRVEARAGGRADERPLRFEWEGAWLVVAQVGRAAIVEAAAPGSPRQRLFEVATTCGQRFELRVRDPGWLWQARRLG